MSLVPSKCSATTKKSRTPGRNGVLKRMLLPVSSETNVDTAMADRNAMIAKMRGDQPTALAPELAATASMLHTANPISGISHFRGSAKPAIYRHAPTKPNFDAQHLATIRFLASFAKKMLERRSGDTVGATAELCPCLCW